MNQHKDVQYWKKRKIEVERAAKVLEQKREKTLYLYGVEKLSRQKTRELPLRTLLQYETKELQQAQAGLQAITTRIAVLEKEQKKYTNIKTAGLLSLFVLLFGFLGLVVYDHEEIISESIIVEESTPEISWTEFLGSRAFAFLKKYSSDSNMLTGAVVDIPGNNCREEIGCINETITNCINETVQKCDVVCMNETKEVCPEQCPLQCSTEEVNGKSREVCITVCPPVCRNETIESCSPPICRNVVEQKCSTEIVPNCITETTCTQTIENLTVEQPIYSNESQQNQSSNNETKKQNDTVKPETAPVSVQGGLDILEAPSITALVLNTTDVSVNHTNVNLTAYATVSGPGSYIKVIYHNWFLNGTTSQSIMVNLPFEGGSGGGGGTTRDYSGYENNGSVVGAAGASWESTGGFDNKGAYSLSLAAYIEASDSVATPKSSLNPPRVITIATWLKPTSTQSAGIIDKMTAGNADGYYLGINNNIPKMIIGTNAVTSTYTLPNGIYTHVVGVFNSTHLLIYVNGTLNVTASTPGGTTILANGSVNLRIGINTSGAGAFTGRVDEVTIWNRSLSAAQIWALYQNQSNVLVAQETLRGENWSVQATPNNGSSPFGDGVSVMSNNVTILNAKPVISTVVLNTTNISSNNTDVNLTAYNLSTTDADGDSVKVIYNWLRNGTSIFFLNMPFEGINGTTTNNAWDYSGFGRFATERSGIVWNSTGGYDRKGAYTFNGSNYLDGVLPANNANENLAITAWVKPDSITGTVQTVFLKGAGGVCFGYGISLEGGTGALQARGTSGTPTITGARVVANAWQHIAVVYNASGGFGYINGTFVGNNTGATVGSCATTNYSIGVRPGDSIQPFTGHIDDLTVWNRSLTQQQISALFNNKTDLIVAQETVRGENWTVQVTPNDGYEDGVMVISNNLTIRNTPPEAPLLLNLTNGSVTTSRTPTLSWNVSSDVDSDIPTYRLEVDDNPAFNNPEVNVTGVSNTTIDNVTYTLVTELSVDTSYFWRVFAYDGIDNSGMSATRNFTVQSYLAINVTANNASFGSFSLGQNVSTPANASSLRAENIGNIIANITVTGTRLFTYVGMPSTFYRFKITANESGAFNTTASATEWNQTNTTLNEFVFHVVNLDWHSVSNDFLTNLNISVPGNESAGAKASTITFTITG